MAPDPVHKSTRVNSCRDGVNRRNRCARARAHSAVSHLGIKTPERTCKSKYPKGVFSTHYYKFLGTRERNYVPTT